MPAESSAGGHGRNSGRGKGRGRGGRGGRGGGRGRGRGRGPGGRGSSPRDSSRANDASSEAAAADLLNFRLPSRDRTGSLDGGGTRRSGGGGGGGGRQRKETWKQRERRENAERAERRARRDQGDGAFFLRTSASHRFVLARRGGDGDKKASRFTFSGPDDPVDWDSVRSVRCLVEMERAAGEEEGRTLDDLRSESAVCPICLDAHVCPRMTPCGHTFCLPCMLRHLHGGSLAEVEGYPSRPAQAAAPPRQQQPRSPPTATATRGAPTGTVPTGYAAAAAAAAQQRRSPRHTAGGRAGGPRPPAFPPLPSAATATPVATAPAAVAVPCAWGASSGVSPVLSSAAPRSPTVRPAQAPAAARSTTSASAPPSSPRSQRTPRSPTSVVSSTASPPREAEAKCPCCSVPVSSEGLRPVMFVSVRLPGGRNNDRRTIAEFTKLHRVRGCHAPYLPLPGKVRFLGPHALPTADDGAGRVGAAAEGSDVGAAAAPAKFCRFNYVDPKRHVAHLSSDLDELRRRAVELENEIEAFGSAAGSALDLGFVHMSISAVEEETRRYTLEEAEDEEALRVEDEALGGGSGWCEVVAESLRFNPCDERWRQPVKISGEQGRARIDSIEEGGAGVSAWDYDEDDKAKEDVDVAAAAVSSERPANEHRAGEAELPSVSDDSRRGEIGAQAAELTQAVLANEVASSDGAAHPPQQQLKDGSCKDGETSDKAEPNKVGGIEAEDSAAQLSATAESRVGGRRENRRLQRRKQQRPLPDPGPASMYLEPDSYAFYQSSDGQLAFLSPFNVNCLTEEFSPMDPTLGTDPVLSTDCSDPLTFRGEHSEAGDTDMQPKIEQQGGGDNNDESEEEQLRLQLRRRRPLPDSIRGPVVGVEKVHLTPDARRRLGFLSHLPLYADVRFVELDLNAMLSEGTKEKFRAEGQRRAKARKDRRAREKRMDRAGKEREEVRIAELRARTRAAAVDPDDKFFRGGAAATNIGGSEVYDPESFGPSLMSDNGGGDSPAVSTVSPPPASSGAATAFSFRTICAEGGAFPELGSSVAAASKPSLRARQPTPWGSASSSLPHPPSQSPRQGASPDAGSGLRLGRSSKKGGNKVLLLRTGGHRG